MYDHTATLSVSWLDLALPSHGLETDELSSSLSDASKAAPPGHRFAGVIIHKSSYNDRTLDQDRGRRFIK